MELKEIQNLHSNQRLLVLELQSRGVKLDLIDSSSELIEASYNGHSEFLLDRDSSIIPYNTSIIVGDKILSKFLLYKAGISINQGKVFWKDNLKEALSYAKTLGFPLVVKPNFGSHGDNVSMNLYNINKTKKAILSFIKENRNKPFIIEKQFNGKEYRIFITKEGKYAVLHRDPAHVFGDGRHSLKELINIENRKREARKNSLCLIKLDKESKDYLNLLGKKLSDIPKKAEKVYIRANSNIATGGFSEDYTNKVHPSVIKIAKKVLNVFHGMPYAGIDFMSKDILKEQTPDLYRIIEINSNPGIHMHASPGRGNKINIASIIADIIFPETKDIKKLN